MLNRDFKRLSETIDKQINDEQIIVDSMVRKLEKLQMKKVFIKHDINEGRGIVEI